MLIKINSINEVNIIGGIRIHSKYQHQNIYVFPSPNHWQESYKIHLDKEVTIYELANIFKNECILLIDEAKSVITFSRDFQGNRMIYYSIKNNFPHLIISDSIKSLSKHIKNIKLKENRCALFLESRKHYHLKTSFDGINILLPGLTIGTDFHKRVFFSNYWYKFLQKIVINDVKNATQIYRSSIDNVINKLINKDQPIALMFSGGSDSTLLLERMISIGIKNIKLFNIKIKGKKTELYRAKKIAKLYNFNLNIIEINIDEGLNDWVQLISNNYICISDLRINGMYFATSMLYKKLKEIYKNKKLNIIWGLQHTVAAPGFKLKNIVKFYLFYYTIRVFRIFNMQYLDKIALNYFLKMTNITYNNSPAIQVNALKKLLEHIYRTINNKDQIINLKILFSNSRKKEFSIERQNTAIKNIYPDAKNIFPYYDRTHQEDNLKLSLSSRLGGIFGMLKTPESMKNLILKAFENINKKNIIGGNKDSLESWKSVSKDKRIYEKLINILHLNDNKILKPYINKLQIFNKPYKNVNVKEIEKVSAICSLSLLTKQLRKGNE